MEQRAAAHHGGTRAIVVLLGVIACVATPLSAVQMEGDDLQGSETPSNYHTHEQDVVSLSISVVAGFEPFPSLWCLLSTQSFATQHVRYAAVVQHHCAHLCRPSIRR